MKKIIALIIAAGTLTSVSAQYHGNDDRMEQRGDNYGNATSRNVYANKGGDYSYNSGRRDAEIQQINRQIDDQIWSVKNNWRMRPQEKNRQIAMLERQREESIRNFGSRNDGRNDRYDDRMARNNRRGF